MLIDSGRGGQSDSSQGPRGERLSSSVFRIVLEPPLSGRLSRPPSALHQVCMAYGTPHRRTTTPRINIHSQPPPPPRTVKEMKINMVRHGTQSPTPLPPATATLATAKGRRHTNGAREIRHRRTGNEVLA
ncbi:uncharacterized protein MYCGRDRAFT_98717 [Zymoseptoria tritici IPO323]|uniref:Uncharacterized protein n=1 Tax=Zymoseptoria tritici (strain CBS 115943 / IPO323) TaxID=336722 RepID=F9X0E6_ZYMTI|nr:uncharacterized protein MYCGRDRAFT_98717 [Zymoseptoria tritici IPO323]EGP91529.1 hypothetical protein MYCGRDRAFT_98717 [Zymoseptoria tritici IPO323]